MPATPPVVRRRLIGSAQINGSHSVMTAYNSDTSLTVANASTFPMSGNFWLQEVQQIDTRYFTPTEDVLASTTFNTRLQGTPIKYSFTNRLVLQTTGNTVVGQNTVTNLGSTAGVAKGQNVFMAGVPSYALLTPVRGSTLKNDFSANSNGPR